MRSLVPAVGLILLTAISATADETILKPVPATTAAVIDAAKPPVEPQKSTADIPRVRTTTEARKLVAPARKPVRVVSRQRPVTLDPRTPIRVASLPWFGPIPGSPSRLVILGVGY